MGQSLNLIPTKHWVSVIIPTFNASERLLLLLKSLGNQSVGNFEVVVVDDGSTDTTREAVAALIEGYPVSLRYYYLDNTDIFGAGIARNHGAKQAKGDILLFLDQDCVAAGDLVQKHIEHHRTKDVILGYYAGYGNEKRRYVFLKLKDRVHQGKSIPAIKEFRDRLFEDASADDAWKCFVSAHFSIKKKIFGDVCFDEAFLQWGCEDVELGYRLVQSGNTVHFLKDCVVYNSSSEPPRTKEKFLSLSKSLIDMYRKHPAEDMKLYCFERFYHTPLKHRGSLQLIFEGGGFELRELKTDIIIDKNFCARIALGSDFLETRPIIADIIRLIKGVHFDIGIIRDLEEPVLSDFRNSFHHLIKILRESGKDINLDDIRKQSFLAGKRFVGPRELSIDFYNKCNVKCLFCSIYSPLMKNTKYVPRALDLATIERILDQAYEMGVQKIRLLSDGEPLLSQDASAILESIQKKSFELMLLTNATVLKKEHLFVMNKIRNLSLLVNFSAAQKETYQKIYGGNPNNYDFVLNALRLFSLLKAAKRKRGENISLATTYVITNLNYREISEHIELVKRLGVDHVYLKFAILYDEAEALLLDKAQMQELRVEVLKAKIIAARLPISTNLDEILNNIDDERFQDRNDIKDHSVNLPTEHCYNGWFFANLNAFGNYYICCRETVHVGNVHEQGFKGIFFSPPMTDLLAEGAAGISLDKRMWSKCNYCYHLGTNKMAKKYLEENEAAYTRY